MHRGGELDLDPSELTTLKADDRRVSRHTISVKVLALEDPETTGHAARRCRAVTGYPPTEVLKEALHCAWESQFAVTKRRMLAYGQVALFLPYLFAEVQDECLGSTALEGEVGVVPDLSSVHSWVPLGEWWRSLQGLDAKKEGNSDKCTRQRLTLKRLGQTVCNICHHVALGKRHFRPCLWCDMELTCEPYVDRTEGRKGQE
mmetsp:Transcript_908/g.2012  ORF Transcript_908/g.2012 Transcript_908/m.2012 type:complete len:202 (+) Transcript_908:834-1439(+)